MRKRGWRYHISYFKPNGNINLSTFNNDPNLKRLAWPRKGKVYSLSTKIRISKKSSSFLIMRNGPPWKGSKSLHLPHRCFSLHFDRHFHTNGWALLANKGCLYVCVSQWKFHSFDHIFNNIQQAGIILTIKEEEANGLRYFAFPGKHETSGKWVDANTQCMTNKNMQLQKWNSGLLSTNR